MTSDTPLRQPNAPIFLEDISITHINGHVLAVPCSASVTLHLSPGISCRIASDNLPTAMVKLQHEAFSITTSNGCTIKVFLRYNLNDFFYSNAKESFKGFLAPCKLPSTVIQSDTQIQSVSFSILNFPEFSGQSDKWIDLDENSSRLGVAILEHENLRIEITEDPMFSENRKLLNRDDGYAVTHTGIIQHCDGKPLSVAKVECIIRGLRALLSFARGSACGISVVKATNQNDDEILLEWGTNYTEPWSVGGTRWLPKKDGGDSLSQLFPGFWDLYNNSDWSDTICNAIDWYVNSSSPFHVGVILAQAALESLSFKILGKQVRPKHKMLRKSLKKMGIDENIPQSCFGLKKFSDSIMQKKPQSIGDGPEALTEIRNDLVHSKKNYDHISAEAQMDAQRLGRWYIELIMLKKFGYHGRYKNCLKSAGENPYENVPWSIEPQG